MSKPAVLIIEDEITITRVLKTYFEKDGYNVTISRDGFSGLQDFEKGNFDIIFLDINMPNIDGWDVARAIRETSDVPIVMISAQSDDESILKGYELKIDDFVPKPFNPKILLAKANLILDKRLNVSNNSESKEIKNSIVAGKVEILYDARKVYLDGNEIKLSKTEYDLLYYFIINKNKVLSRDQLLEEVWGMDTFVEDRIIDTYIKNLRKYLGEYKYIKTAFGVGYRFEVE